jgi:sugar lactone lactonase YvrE
MTTHAPSQRSFEDALLAELLAVQGELLREGTKPPQRAGAGTEKRAVPREGGPRRRLPGRPGRGYGRGGTGERWRAIVAVAGLCAAIVAAALVVANLRAAGQRITIRPAAQGALPAGTILVAQGGTTYAQNVGNNGCCYVNQPYEGTSVRALGAVTAYAAAATGNAAPVATFTKEVRGPATMAFSPSGDLWVADDTGRLVEFTRAQLTKANPSPSVTISLPIPLVHAWGLAFDHAGDLWVVNSTGGAFEYTRAQLARSGFPTPHTTILQQYLNSPVGAAFDPSGDLWVANAPDLLFEFSPHDLAGSNPTPSVRISSASLDNPYSVVSDASGDLWVGNSSNPEVAEFTRSQLAKSGHIAAHVVISPTSRDQLSGWPSGLAVDSSGNLWVDVSDVGNNGRPGVVELAKDQLAKSGSPVPARVIAGTKTRMNFPNSLVLIP